MLDPKVADRLRTALKTRNTAEYHLCLGLVSRTLGASVANRLQSLFAPYGFPKCLDWEEVSRRQVSTDLDDAHTRAVKRTELDRALWRNDARKAAEVMRGEPQTPAQRRKARREAILAERAERGEALLAALMGK